MKKNKACEWLNAMILSGYNLIGKTMNVTYYVLSYDKWELKVDKSYRIYFCVHRASPMSQWIDGTKPSAMLIK
ncbi:MAG: hypothetical protein A2491_21925 [Bacteroidetes bacterium RIFOXYC12_FULL_35_7]|nr:MAG: hypothetical protein A2491_21925 [Bacteroidetes bacterium RIFOXYC12_FULL_35_7]